MKKYTITRCVLSGVLAGATITMSAQDSYDSQRFSSSDLNGTSRYVSMGGALGALGGDLTLMGTNPAGTAIYRRSDAAITAGVLLGDKGALDHSSSRMSLDQGGALIVFDMENSSGNGLQYVNFGINFTKRNNYFFNQRTDVQNLNGIFSQTNQIADLCALSYSNNYFGKLTDMSAAVFTGNNRRDGLLYERYYDSEGNLLGSTVDESNRGTPGFLTEENANKVTRVDYTPVGAQSAYFEKATYGGINQADVNLSFNVSNRFFFGASVGIYDIDYTRETFYQEMGVDNNVYDFTNWYKTTGDGYDVKLGMIARPFEDSPFRIGLSIHTPTWYRMTDSNGSVLYLNDARLSSAFSDEYDYDMRTPWRFGVSLGHTIGTSVAIGAEYEYTDPSTAHYSEADGAYSSYFSNVNRITEQTLKGQHTLKLGLELKPIDSYSLRFGYNYVSSPFKSGAYRTIGFDGVYTETHFTNWNDTHRFCFGAGYSFKGGYIDLAYQYQAQKGDFYAFDDVDLKPTKVENNRSQVMATLGFRF